MEFVLAQDQIRILENGADAPKQRKKDKVRTRRLQNILNDYAIGAKTAEEALDAMRHNFEFEL